MTHTPDTREGSACDDCPISSGRRAFLRDMGRIAAVAVGAMALGQPAVALAEGAMTVEPLGATAMERTYAFPRMDGAYVDLNGDVILARWQGRVYAFSTKCPHKCARLEWRDDEQRVFCPKHKARFRADGAHVSGRGSRDLDRYALRRQGDTVIVDVGRAYRQDSDPGAWQTAVISSE